MAENLQLIFSQWGFDLKFCRPDLHIAGSPDRAVKREVLESTAGELFVIEMLPLANREARERQAYSLAYLADRGLRGISPWLYTRTGSLGYVHEGHYWQLRRWIPGEPLPRETYALDAWRGGAAAEFLVRLRELSQESGFPGTTGHPFGLMHYIGHLMPHFQRQLPALVTDMAPMVQALQGYGEFEAQARTPFCHGDFHPGNLLWGEKAVNGVIDWEFCGRKPAGYDAANILGCLGMDDPAFLTGPMAAEFIGTLQRAGFLTAEEWHFLPDQIAALRFAWMREWVARRDKAMITQELDFIWLILDNRSLLRDKWKAQ